MRALAALTLLVLLTGCGSDAGTDAGVDTQTGPEATVEQLVTALEAGSCADVKAIVVTPATIDCEMIASLKGSYAAEGVDLADITYSVEEVVGDSGSVAADTGNGEPPESWSVERFEEGWKVVFDSEE